ncbi:hypothetical protein PM082_023909 [Marasmius tenuissimus]|nr:hypothetical protein PM082_023909 [Marasmius tenuissimus]
MDNQALEYAELQFVSRFGKGVMLSVIGLITSALLYGIYGILFYASVTILRRREGNVTARRILLAAIALMFGISSFEFWADTMVILTSIKSVFVDKVETPFIEKQTNFAEKFTRLVSVQEVFNPLEVKYFPPFSFQCSKR